MNDSEKDEPGNSSPTLSYIYHSGNRRFSVFIPWISGAVTMQSGISRRPGRLKPPNISTSPDDIHLFASHSNEVRCVLRTMDTIMATTVVIVREAEVRIRLVHTNIYDENHNSMFLLGRGEGFTYTG